MVSTLATLGCTDADPRAQWVVVVDTDAPLTGQLVDQPELPADAAIDSLRIDVIAADGERLATRELTVPDPRDWPISFGVVAEGPRPERLRLRAYRGRDATVDAEGLLVPPPRRTIDRVVTFDRGPEGREEIGIRLSFACLGVRPSFASPLRTCIDDDRQQDDPSRGHVEVPTVVSAGTSPLLTPQPCTGQGPAGTVCIAGGFSVLGDDQLSGIDDLLVVDAIPPVPVIVSPFWMDRTEVTVGMVRALYAGGLSAEEPVMPDPGVQGLERCTWRGRDDASQDSLPINCLAVATTDAICAVRGGRLPTEAEWEHAAGGRGAGRVYPWGEESACCGSQLGRFIGPCSSFPGPVPVGTFASPDDCAFGDVSRDGLLDLGGNVVEITSDPAEPFDAPCWSHDGIARNPRCLEGDDDRVARGGAWTTGLAIAHTSHRKVYVPASNAGLRCVFEDRP